MMDFPAKCRVEINTYYIYFAVGFLELNYSYFSNMTDDSQI